MGGKVWGSLALAAGSAFVSVSVLELGMRLLISPSDVSSGRLAGIELPPVRLSPPKKLDHDAPDPVLVDGGQPLSRGDLWGILREDRVLGYAPRENAVSLRGWWQSNNIGARARTDTLRARPAGRRRVLVFGDSFTNGSRVPQEETWPHLLAERAPDWDVVNLAVDGYGMGQALLRYRLLRDRVEHDAVLLGFVPREDLIRDVNTLRSLLGWRGFPIVPRFVLEHGELKLIPSPFESAEEMWTEVANGSATRFFSHLRLYDALYFDALFELPPLIGRLASYRLLVGWTARARHREVKQESMRPGSEALAVTRAIVDAMASETRGQGKDFLLVYIPLSSDLGPPAGRAQWAHLTEHCPEGAIRMDLLERFPRRVSDLDWGRDGTHYGPRTNALIAEAVQQRLPGPR